MPPNPAIEDAEAMLKAVNEAAGTARAVFVGFMVLALYFLIVVAGTDDLALLRNATVAVPTLSNATLPAFGFYVCAAPVFVFMHLDLLIHYQMLSMKLFRFNELLETRGINPDAAHGQRLQLASFPFASWLGSDPRTLPWLHRLQGIVVWLTIIALPLTVLTALQLGFLAYQSELVTWVHRAAVSFDVLLLLYFWPRLVGGRYRVGLDPSRRGRAALAAWSTLWVRLVEKLALRASGLGRMWPRRAWQIPVSTSVRIRRGLLRAPGATVRRGWVLLPALPLLLVAWTVATIPNEPLDRWARLQWGGPVQARAVSCAGLFDHEKGREAPGELLPCHMQVNYLAAALFHLDGALFRRTLTVRNRVVAQSDVPLAQVATLRKSRRNELADRPRYEAEPSAATCRDQKDEPNCLFVDAVDQIVGLDLRKRSLLWADFQGSAFPRANMAGARMDYARLITADLRAVDLTGAELRHAAAKDVRLSGALLDDAVLSDANLEYAYLADVKARRTADFSNASLKYAILARADLSGARFNQANLADADLNGVTARKTHFVGAKLRNARINGTGMSQAQLVGADLSFAKMIGAYLVGANLIGSGFLHTDLTGSDLGDADLAGWELEVAILTGARLVGAASLFDLPIDRERVRWLRLDSSVQWTREKAQVSLATARKQLVDESARRPSIQIGDALKRLDEWENRVPGDKNANLVRFGNSVSEAVDWAAPGTDFPALVRDRANHLRELICAERPLLHESARSGLIADIARDALGFPGFSKRSHVEDRQAQFVQNEFRAAAVEALKYIDAPSCVIAEPMRRIARETLAKLPKSPAGERSARPIAKR